jgi:hypothetical protein
MMNVYIPKKSPFGGFRGRSVLLVLTLAASNVFPDATVVQSGSPAFPLQVDNVTLIVHRSIAKKRDSVTFRLPVSFYAELRDNIDTIFTYADALRKHRRELSCTADAAHNGSSLTFEYMGLRVMSIFFPDQSCTSGKLVAAEDRYPFVVVLTKGFSARLKKLIKTGPR